MKKAIVYITLLTLAISCKIYKEEKKPEAKVDVKNVYIERDPLPYPDEIKNATYNDNIDTLINERDSIQSAILDVSNEAVALENKKTVIDELDHSLALNADKISIKQFESLCRNNDDSQPVETYDGTLGVSKQFAEKMYPSVGQLQWKYNFGNEFDSANSSEGNVKGVRWCTGSLIDKNIFITAGHCFDRKAGSWRLPVKNGQTISSKEIARLMKVNFNYQADKATGQIRTDTIDYPVLDLLEYRNGNWDYAIILLGKDRGGKYPGERFGVIEVSRSMPEKNDIVAIIQHPLGNPKVIEAGPIFSISDNLINYDDIDTQGGSSGSPVISSLNNRIVGIHVQGGCDNKDDGSNHATPVFLILQSSPIIRQIAK